MENKNSLGKIIATLRNEKGWTQLELAQKLNVTDKAVSKWESDNGSPSKEFYPMLADLFGVSVDYLMNRENNKFMKCTVCGHDKLKKIRILDNQVVATEGYVAQTVDSYACEQCGHVELYVNSKSELKKGFEFKWR